MVNFKNKKHGLYLETWEEYQKQVKLNKNKQEAALQQFTTAKRKDKKLKQFIKYEEANIAGTEALFYMQYPAHHGHFTRQPSLAFWENVDLKTVEALKNRADKDLLMSKPYRDFLNQYALAMAEKAFLESNVKLNDKAHFISKSYFKADKLFTHQWQKDYVKSRFLYEFMNQNGIGGMEKVMKDYQQLSMPKAYRKAVEKVWNKWASTKPGAVAPEIIGQDINGKEVKLSDFRGKVVYIDVWATWCGPCRQQIPFLKETETRFHGKDVVFLSVSTDNDKKKWKNYVKKHNLTGVQIHNPGGWSSDICKKYNITGIPRFMLIDKEGKIITVKAHRPSQGIDDILNKHLGN